MESREKVGVVGAGVGGLAAALALARAGLDVQVFERSAVLSEVGAGIQLGPNAVRVLAALGVDSALRPYTVAVASVDAHSSTGGSLQPLGRLDLQSRALRYGAPYLTVHRADLQAALLHAAQAAGVRLVRGHKCSPQDREFTHSRLVVADGIWSTWREQLRHRGQGGRGVAQGAAGATGHLAWRSLLPLKHLPPMWQEPRVRAWLGAHHHIVSYPVGGDRLNVVAFTEGAQLAVKTWSEAASTSELLTALNTGAPLLPALQQLLHAGTWTRWPVFERPALESAHDMQLSWREQAVPLVGDAAHPMRPYMAQGAAMALEDGLALAQAWQANPHWPAAVQAYAQARWERCARVQRKAARNGRIFHAEGWLRWARDLSLAVAPQVMDAPWLFGGGPARLEPN